MKRFIAWFETKKGFITMFLLVIGLWVGFGFFMSTSCIVSPPENAGTFGDMYGTINALFGGLTLLGVFYSILLTRRELSDAKVEAQKKDESNKIQVFENTFFELLRTHNEILKLIDYRNNRNQIISQGRDCFRTFHKLFNDELNKVKRAMINASSLASYEELQEKMDKIALTKSQVIASYVKMFEKHEGDLGHYFRHLYHIFRFVDESSIRNKKRYVRLIRAQLSSYELVLIFFNCLSPFGREKFKPLLEKYAILKNMNWILVGNDDWEELIFSYKPYTYGSDVAEIHNKKQVKIIFTGRYVHPFAIAIFEKHFEIRSKGVPREKSILIGNETPNKRFKDAVNSIIQEVCFHFPDWIPGTDRIKIINILGDRIVGHLVILGSDTASITIRNPITNITEANALKKTIH